MTTETVAFEHVHYGWDEEVTAQLDPVARLVSFANILVVNPASPARDMAGLIAHLRANPGATYG